MTTAWRPERVATPWNAVSAERNRAVATLYDKLAVRHEATLHIAAINEWLRSGFLSTP